MPDAEGNTKGISVPDVPWHEDPECPNAPRVTDGDHAWISTWQSHEERCAYCGKRQVRADAPEPRERPRASNPDLQGATKKEPHA